MPLGLSLGIGSSLSAGGGYASLVTNGVLAPYVTFTRASSGTYYDSAGVLQTALTNVPRIDYDPSTLALRGLLIEEARTNRVLNSATLVTQSVTVAAVAHTLSFTGTGTVTLSGVSTAGPLVGTGATNRVTLTFTPTAGSLTLTVTGTCTLGQLEAGAFATSPIPTTSAAVTRAADVAGNSTLSSIGFNSAEWTLYVQFSAPPNTSASDFPGVCALIETAGGANNTSTIYCTPSGGNRIRANTRAAAVSTEITGLTGYAIGATYSVAIAVAAGAQSIVVNGGSATTSTSALPTSLAKLVLGRRLESGFWLNSSIKNARLYPRSLTNAELQALTA